MLAPPRRSESVRGNKYPPSLDVRRGWRQAEPGEYGKHIHKNCVQPHETKAHALRCQGLLMCGPEIIDLQRTRSSAVKALGSSGSMISARRAVRQMRQVRQVRRAGSPRPQGGGFRTGERRSFLGFSHRLIRGYLEAN